MRDLTVFYMNMAEAYAQLSYCKRFQVGCVIVKDTRVISQGYNGTVKGVANVCELPDGSTSPLVIHAEQNSIIKAARDGQALQGSILYSTLSPCPTCSVCIAQAGISEVYYSHVYRDTTGLDLLDEIGLPHHHYQG